jgi:MYXO-CTERM domain-containing protein
MRFRKPGASEPPAAAGEWSEPPELRRHVPRQLGLSAGGKAAAVLVAALVTGGAAAGVALYTSAERNRALSEALETRGVAAEARVLETRRRDKGRRLVIYGYTAQGREYSGRVTVPRGDRRALEPGSRLPVRYLPDDPRRAWPAGYDPSGPPVWTAAAAPAGFAALALVLAWSIRRQKWLLSMGRAVEGRVIGARKVHTRHGSSHTVEYEFRTLSGSVRRVKIAASGRKPPAPGTAVTLLYDPDNPSRAAVYPLSLARVAD